MQVRHGKYRIEVDGRPIMLHGSVRILGMFPAEGGQVVRSGIQFISGQNFPAHGFGGLYFSRVSQQNCSQKLRVVVLRRLRR